MSMRVESAAPETAKTTLVEIAERCYRELRPRAPMPVIQVRHYRFAHVNNTVRLREGTVFLRLSDVLEGAPLPVLEAIIHILLAKLYRKPIDKARSTRFRKYVSSAAVAGHAERVRQTRGRKLISSAQGRTWDLEEVFESLNRQFFFGLLGQPVLTWSTQAARRMLGHYDSAHNTIVISKVFDRPGTPRYAIEYIVYHEMLHLKHPVKLRGARRCVHPQAFQADEKMFPQLEEAKKFLKTL
jgi:hypothetical protein